MTRQELFTRQDIYEPGPIARRIIVIASCALLYAFMCSPMLFHVQVANAIPASMHPVLIAGLAVQWLAGGGLRCEIVTLFSSL